MCLWSERSKRNELPQVVEPFSNHSHERALPFYSLSTGMTFTRGRRLMQQHGQKSVWIQTIQQTYLSSLTKSRIVRRRESFNLSLHDHWSNLFLATEKSNRTGGRNNLKMTFRTDQKTSALNIPKQELLRKLTRFIFTIHILNYIFLQKVWIKVLNFIVKRFLFQRGL